MSSNLRPRILLIGSLTRDFIFYPGQAPRLDIPGGGALYAAAGAILWEKALALVSQVGSDYPAAWKTLLEERGLDVSGVRQLDHPIESRAVYSYDDELRPGFPLVRACLRAGIPFPAALLGYQPEKDASLPSPFPVFDLPASHQQAEAAYLSTISLENLPQWIAYLYTHQIRHLVATFPKLDRVPHSYTNLLTSLEGLEVLLIHEKDLRTLFWGISADIHEMAMLAGKIIPHILVHIPARRCLLYVAHTSGFWEISAYPGHLFSIGIEEAFGGGFLAGLLHTSDPLQAALHGAISAAFKGESPAPFYNWDVLPALAHARLEYLRLLTHPL